MKQYIDKDDLKKEIERRIEEHKFLASMAADNNLHNTLEANELLITNYSNLMHFIDTLEVKEVDLEKEINHWQGCEAFPEGVNITPLPKAMDIVERTAKHFFELGLKAQKGE